MTNKVKIFTGQIDAPLSPIGEKQSELLEKYISENFNISAVYSSDLIRAKKTVENLACSCNVPLVLSRNLREIDAGLWQGKTMEEIEEVFSEQLCVWHSNQINCCLNGGETVKNAIDRAINEVIEIARKNADRTVVVCAHGLAIRALWCSACGTNLSDMTKIRFASNASVSLFTFSDEKLTPVFYDKNDFLGNFSTSMPEKF